ncbi:MAG TPA: BrnT family toxin [Alphaproteobacteria bacterium]|nr:BrnT family toxin [Alphaproteobacteria bacterium]
MRFAWDEQKSRRNLAKHKVSFETAKLVFDDPRAVSRLDRVEDGEERWQTLGLVGSIVVLLVAHTSREEDGEEVIRIISARKATAHERTIYEQGG